MNKIPLTDAIKLIFGSAGKLFTVTFIKRTTGEERCLNCRLGVTKHLKGGELSYDPTSNGLIGVFDMKSNGYRMIPIEGIKSLKIEGKEYEVGK